MTIKGTGHIRGGDARLPGDVSSQFVSALLTVAPLADASVKISLTTRARVAPIRVDDRGRDARLRRRG